ncbi:MFS domain-containing protein [Fusarium falciforme]|uniref:MFS domain-containing protein n=1 Tax=Fusarium falciforme TaxID=195108 RepID=UPI0023016040|nr:MFS domain-containing protein [Fusarium falciforme]WAO96637.1 MFS domain-containing protein [Fusarium falciforme]
MLFHKIKSDPGLAPDGGARAWLQVVAGCLINALTWGYSASFGVYQLYYTTEFDFPPSQVSWVGSIQVFLTFFVGVLSGRSADAGLAQQTVLLGCFMGVLGTFMTSLATTYWQIFLAQGLCTGLGMGLMYMPTVAVISSYFQKKRALALTTSASGSGVGSIVFPLVVQNLQTKIGFAWAVRVQAFIALFFSIIIITLLKPRLPPRKSGPLMELRAFLEPSYSFFTIGMFFIFWPLYFAFFYVNTYATSKIGVSGVTAANLLVIINAVGIPSRPLLGFLSDRWFGPLPTLVASSTFLGCMLFVWISVKSLGGMYAWVVIYGIATGGTQGIFVGALASLTKDPSKMGTRFGMVFSVLGFCTLAGPPTAGGMIENMNGSFLGAQIWAGVVTITGTLFIVAALCADKRANAKDSPREGDGESGSSTP